MIMHKKTPRIHGAGTKCAKPAEKRIVSQQSGYGDTISRSTVSWISIARPIENFRTYRRVCPCTYLVQITDLYCPRSFRNILTTPKA